MHQQQRQSMRLFRARRMNYLQSGTSAVWPFRYRREVRIGIVDVAQSLSKVSK